MRILTILLLIKITLNYLMMMMGSTNHHDLSFFFLDEKTDSDREPTLSACIVKLMVFFSNFEMSVEDAVTFEVLFHRTK